MIGAPDARKDLDQRMKNRRSLLRLLLVVGLAVAVAGWLHGLNVLVVIVALIIMVMLHELGHFVAAKWSKMKVTEYFLGFGPRVWSIRKGETEYGVKAIPAGGYVRVVGMTTLEEVEPEDEARSYRAASFPRRIAVGVAGSFMHFVMAFVLLWAMYSFSGVPVATGAEISGLTKFANATSPAATAGIRPGDVIVSVNGQRFLNPEDYVSYIEARPDRTLHVVVRRNGHRKSFTLQTLNAVGLKVRTATGEQAVLPGVTKATGLIGVDLSFTTTNETVNPLIAVQRSGSLLASVTKQTVSGIGSVFSLHGLGSFAHAVVSSRPGTSSSSSSSSSSGGGQLLSVLGVVQIGAQAASQNVSELLYILVAINVFVGIVNLFPMLPLDGGHVAIAVYERIRSRRRQPYHADVAKLMPVAYLFLAFIVVLGLSALYLNIVHPASIPGG